MAYGIIKVDTVTFTDGGIDKSVSISGLVQNPTFSGNVTVTGTLSGVTVTGTTANFVSGVFSSQISGTTVTGTTASFTSGVFANISGGTHTITSGVFAAGSAASPSISFTSDPDTGLYSPGANQVALSTNGTGRLFVDASGRVGVGSSSFSTGELVKFYQGNSGSTSTTNGLNGVVLERNLDTGLTILTPSANNGSIAFGDEASASVGRIRYLHSSDAMLFQTAGSEKLRITSDGKVGIGTSSPGERFTVANGDMQLQGSTYTNFSDFWGSGDNSAFFLPYGYLGSNGAFNVSLYANGYRNTTPGFTYMGIAGNTNTAAGIDLDPAGEIFLRTGTASGTALPTRLFINSTGNVGIGTTSPLDILDVSGTASVKARIRSTSGAAFAGHLYQNADTGTGATNGLYVGIDDSEVGYIFHYDNNPLAFGTNFLERARIDSSGRLLVGTSSARSNFYNGTDTGIFQVEGANDITKRFSSIIYGRDNADGPLLLLGKHRGTSVGSSTLVVSGDEIGRITFQGTDGSEFVAGAEIQAFVDGTPGANDMPGRLVFSVTADGASSPTEAMRIKNSRILNFANTPVYADNAAAKTGGLVDGDVYRKSDGTLMIVYT